MGAIVVISTAMFLRCSDSPLEDHLSTELLI